MVHSQTKDKHGYFVNLSDYVMHMINMFNSKSYYFQSGLKIHGAWYAKVNC
jgi:hypothetical protein